MAQIPCFPVIHGYQPRPDSSKLHHPPPSPVHCGTAETGEIFRAVGGVLQVRCHQRHAGRAELASFSVLVSNLDFRVPRLRQIKERALTGDLAGSGKEATRETRIEAEATAA